MAGTIAIKNGYVFDPLNEINGEIMDIFIRDGKVVREISAAELKDSKIIDASGMTVMRGHPRYNPGEFTTVDVLREKDVDAAFVMCADLVSHIPADCAAYLAKIPMVCLDIAPCPTVSASEIILPGVIDAMECDGTFYRLDDVPVHFEPFTTSPFDFTKSNEDTLKQLFEKIRKKGDQVISLLSIK